MAERKIKPAPDLQMTRVLDAPRDLVFKVWTDPKHMKLWWGPRGFTNTHCDVDARVGGKIHIDMKGPDGSIYPMAGTFTEVIPPQKLAFTSSALDAAGKPLFEILTTVTFDERQDRTHVTVEARITMRTPAGAPHLAGMYIGWEQMLDRVADYAACNSPEAFTVYRVLNAPRELVFKVWTERDHLLKWFGPKGCMLKVGKLDLKVGGVFHYAMTGPDGKNMWGKWTFRDIAPPESLCLISSFSDEKGGITVHPFAKDWPRETLSLTTLEDTGDDKTRLTIRWLPYNATDTERKVFANSHASMQGGWKGTLDVLEEYLVTL